MKKQIVELDDFKITIKELRIKDIRKAISNIKEVFDGDLDIEKFINERYEMVVDIVSGFIVVDHNDYTVEDLTFSDLEKIIPKFKEVNKSFLDMMDSMGVLDQVTTPTSKDPSIKQSED